MICRDIFLWVSFDVNLLCNIVFSVKKVNCFFTREKLFAPCCYFKQKISKSQC